MCRGVGNSLGAYLGGVMYEHVGAVLMFRYSLVLVGTGLLFVLCSRRQHSPVTTSERRAYDTLSAADAAAVSGSSLEDG